jgi:trans-aconitate 2-methyltransferase
MTGSDQAMKERETLKVRWDPDQYRRFASHRLRPALDLAARLEGLDPRTIYDLGCGTGEITRLLAARWPAARVLGVDSSEEMLEKARGQAGAPAEGTNPVTFERGDLATWKPPRPGDLLFSNAAYHWIPDHRSVFPRLLDSLAPGGALAVQMPMSWDLPSHRAMREVLHDGRGGGGAPFGTQSLRDAMGRKPLLETVEYYGLLAPRAQEIDLWETEYLQALEGDDPVLEWVRGTGLRPILEGLAGEERDAFVERYRMRLRVLYPRGAHGRTLYPFRRLFLYARV